MTHQIFHRETIQVQSWYIPSRYFKSLDVSMCKGMGMPESFYVRNYLCILSWLIFLIVIHFRGLMKN